MTRGLHGETFGLAPCDLRPPTLARWTFCDARDDRSPGWMALRSASRHPLQALLFAAFVAWRERRVR